jgi:hypothetical protein
MAIRACPIAVSKPPPVSSVTSIRERMMDNYLKRDAPDVAHSRPAAPSAVEGFLNCSAWIEVGFYRELVRASPVRLNASGHR